MISVYDPRPCLLIFLILIVSCTGPAIAPGARYQTTSVASDRGVGPVAELQRKAISVIGQKRYADAVEYLRRAIKIDPRNAFSWHYLAQTYWHDKQFDRCLDMIERSISYSTKLDDLDRANAALTSQCKKG